MNGREARPGKPGHWNGRKQRWRAYTRAFRKMDPAAAARVADREIAWKARIVRLEVARRVLRLVAAGALAVLALGALATLQCAVHRPRPAVEEAHR